MWLSGVWVGAGRGQGREGTGEGHLSGPVTTKPAGVPSRATPSL